MTQALELKAPLSGKALPLSQVPDPVFAGLMMGDGLAIDPTSGTLLAPCDGVIAQVARTGHALTLTAANGAEILMHVGIDTVSLKGEGFRPLVAQGASVTCGQPLIEADLGFIAGKVPSLITVVVIANSDAYVPQSRAEGALTAGQSAFMSVHAKGEAKPVETVAADAGTSAWAVVGHGDGVHARPAAMIQAAAKGFNARVVLRFAGQEASARSVVALMGLGIGHGDRVEVLASGAEAEQALAAVVEALQAQSPSAHTELGAESAGAPIALGAGKIGGVLAAPGLAIGPVAQFTAADPRVMETAGELGAEYNALAQALATVRSEIMTQVHAALKRGDKALQAIFDAHLALLDDPELIGGAERAIGQGSSAGCAFRDASQAQRRILLAMNNPLLAERAGDLKDLERRVLLAISGDVDEKPVVPPRSILIADDLTPSDLAALPADALAGVVLARGGATSHVAILVRARGIPAIVAAGPAALQIENGRQVLLDATTGVLDTCPAAEALQDAERQIDQRHAMLEQVKRKAAEPAQTLDGHAIEVAANIANERDAREAVRCGADSVGLLRSEFLFIDRESAPTRAEQQVAYQAVLDAMAGRSAIMRTLDVGGDKDVPYLTLPPEDNPALGLRGVRSGFARPALLDDQLAALLATRPASKLRILLPMVADVADLLRVKTRLTELAAEMGVDELPQLGVMIEVPSAAMLADQLAEHADFLSIGTNDLTQYTLARDRCNPELAAGLDHMHPALLRLIAQTTAGAAKHGRWVGVCGAMASDLEAAPVLIGLGVTELSVSPGLVPELKARVRALDLAMCRREVQPLLQLASAAEVRARAREIWPQA
ncbi:phosphoenolpyruvate--protein phosphotransferase [Paludibacterium purpuratum]|uniref:phosphoenolpyruvate--protein phosphotransferase n=1 Tax=Paludibacterium purpuratum TaxID=1144873 RepID=A0A4V3DVD1_9NEIS|nr:phosphoenolpyruvate--protein phosphotransferase [Paludibacterium purpuratum]TDR80549.1 phosphocarrier protein HPr /phosphoenolpyruvate--protein phosphotransferase /PTS system IIA component (Glc family) [Paludibacterium purpuratum]